MGTTSPQTLLSLGSNSPGTSEAAHLGLLQLAAADPSDINSGVQGLEFKTSIAGNGFGWKIAAPDRFSGNVPLSFAYRNNSASWSELVTMRSETGNVGIGTTSPRGILDIQSSAPAIYVGSPGNSGNSTIILDHSSGATSQQKVAIISDATGAWGQGNLRLAVNTNNDTGNVSTADTKLFVSGTTGNVGIGTTSPALQLQVNKAMGSALNPVTATTSYIADASAGNTQKITLTQSQNVSSATLSYAQQGEPLAFEICQAPSGAPATFLWPSNVSGGTNAIPAAASACVQQSFVYDGSTAVALGPGTPVSVDLAAQGGNISSTNLLLPASSGMFRISIYIIVTRAASTSSTMPSVTISWTDRDNSTTAQSFTATSISTGNTLTTKAQATVVISARAGAGYPVTYSTSGYQSTGTTSMQYALHIRAESM